ncbi:DUF262 domain-containing protein [Pseudomonas aeruginosa]|uniref:DUF262 domain-containing protein n=1 Tax=Pseudomonas aeruginosa TaxID=287 RepID=UPI00093D2C17|nr:DUF262 domain-containing protein [Pseudomonas aeruginosa]EKF7416862.1 DUF262 domain-containing protein [Pseudomonas aeruginosa]MDS9918434.1 DUF262 domain-containing protein [Pseudomonas aeruginosa]RNF58475.1 DUF262 domain-containing protein [Pseudomonas aeruginosa]HCA5866494.1 DUF262 domain-containing protein [Pseudomonas aeruginosa]HCA7376611.1 DUF262 domain-containing protein [Pseudomonas aeruginosa]
MSITLLPKPILDGIQRSYSISMLWEGTAASTSVSEERQLLNLVLPPWQRDVVWTETQQRSFIEGIFLGFGTGYYVINGREYEDDADSYMSGWLLDGQQRITSIARFVCGELAVFNGVRYSDLSIGEKRRRFDNVIFPCIELEYQADEEVLKALYRRLNFGGVAHTAADLQLLMK